MHGIRPGVSTSGLRATLFTASCRQLRGQGWCGGRHVDGIRKCRHKRAEGNSADGIGPVIDNVEAMGGAEETVRTVSARESSCASQGKCRV